MGNELKPLKISCDNAECEKDLHCFRISRKKKNKYPNGHCQVCGIDLINWPRIHKRHLSDARHTIGALKKEWIRHYHWHEALSTKATNYARRKGMIVLRAAVENRIRRSIGPASPWRDGTQTPFGKEGELQDNPVHCAQHATATCCRKCLEYWHGIQRGRDLTGQEISYLSDLVMLYIRERLPNLKDEGERVPRED